MECKTLVLSLFDASGIGIPEADEKTASAFPNVDASSLEKNTKPSIQTVAKIAKGLGISLDKLATN